MEDSLDLYKRMFSEARDLTEEARKDAQVDIDYYHGVQWTAEERRVLASRKQPDQVFNRVKPSVNGTLGVLKQGATDPRAYGRNPQDEDSADVASKVLRFIADDSDFDNLRVSGAWDYLVPGIIAAQVTVGDDNEVLCDLIRWEEFFYDPRSRKADFSDASYMGIAKWMYADDVARQWRVENIDGLLASGPATSIDDTFEDRPKDSLGQWVDRKRRRLMVVELYYREGGGWKRCVFHVGGYLEEPVDSPYVEKKRSVSKPVCPIVAQSCYVDRDNNRYGIVRDMRGPQDEINKRRSKLLHLLNNRQVQVIPNEAAMSFALSTDADTVRQEAGKPDGVLPPGWQPIALNDMAAGQFNLLAQAYSDIERSGPNPAVLAREGENASGRNNLIRQQAGLTEQAIIFGGIEHWELRMYRAMWNRARQYWTAPDYVRVTDDMGAPQFIGINQPQYGPPQIGVDPQTGMPGIITPITGVENELAQLDVDITIDTVPDTANLSMEQFDGLAKMLPSAPPDKQGILWESLFEASTLPNKREIMEKMKAAQEQQAPQQQVAMQIGAAKEQADIAETESKTALNKAKTVETLTGIQIDAFEAGVSAGSAAAGL